MSLSDKVSQYGILIMGLLIGGGFAFGGIASYAGLTGGSGGNSNGNQFNATLPSQNYLEGSLGMNSREQLVLAARNDVVFVNAYYGSQEQLESLRGLQDIPQEFNGRVYVQVVNESSISPIMTEYGVNELPAAVVIGSSRNSQAAVLQDPSKQVVSQAACNAIRNWGSLAARCSAR